MNRLKTILVFFTVSALLSGTVLARDADREAIASIATILAHLNHYPSSAEKQSLQNLMDKEVSEDIKVLVTAMINLKHKAAAVDKVKLEAVLNSDTASAEVKTLAKILLHLNHKPSSTDKKSLNSLK